ncbi:NAD(P)-dependent alcohol dehydrogenase [Chitinophaga sp. Hz27]|uniref:zinc-dependent alcohol dehydrogenase family protein n=1 Tax=Chitinophaga sp. Hz27 TaxID=3347169 RepID=UPI0035E34442
MIAERDLLKKEMSEIINKAFWADKAKGADSLRMVTETLPAPGSQEVLIQVKAAAFNYREVMIIESGVYPLPVKDTFIPMADGVGEIIAVGSAVSNFKAGDRVAAVMFPYWQSGPFQAEFSGQLGGALDGMLTEYKILPAAGVVLIPDHLSYVEAAAYPCAGVTAWNALFGGAALLPGQTVLTLGTGGVSMMALQFARAAGARVIATTSSSEKIGLLQQFGADEVINYKEQPAWHIAVKALTNGKGADHIIEVGGAATLPQSIRAVQATGQISMIGSMATGDPLSNPNLLLTTAATIRAIAAGHRQHQQQMNSAVAVNKLRPLIDRVFPFTDAKEAYQYYLKGQYQGKVVVSME